MHANLALRMSCPISCPWAHWLVAPRTFALREYYDVFWSDADGTPNPEGSYLTIECSFEVVSNGHNIAEVLTPALLWWQLAAPVFPLRRWS